MTFENLLNGFIAVFVDYAIEYRNNPTLDNREKIIEAAHAIHIASQAHQMIIDCDLKCTLVED